MRIPRYRLGGRWYDVLSLERLLYRSGRLAAVELAAPRPGERVLDVGCGTGLSFEPVIRAVGETGRVVGLDAGRTMLRQAARRVARHGWRQVSLVRADAQDLATVCGEPFDVVFFCYSLSIVANWPVVWEQARRCLAPGGRVAVVDTTYLTGWRRVLNPLVWVLFATGGVRPGRRVWDAVARDTEDPVRRRLLAGHVRVAVGTVRGQGDSGER